MAACRMAGCQLDASGARSLLPAARNSAPASLSRRPPPCYHHSRLSAQVCRYHTASALALRRVAKEDVSLGGQTIK